MGGTIHAGDAQAAQAQSDLVIAYSDAASRALTASVAGDLVGQTLTAGVYKSTGPLALSGTLTLDGRGDPNAVFIFQIASTLISASSSNVNLVNAAQAYNVFWQVGSSATLGTTSSFKGTIMALTLITVTTGTNVEGRALARNGQVSLDTNVFTTPVCATAPTTTTTAAPTTTTTTAAPTTTTTTAAPTTTTTTAPIPTAAPTTTTTAAIPTAAPTTTTTVPTRTTALTGGGGPTPNGGPGGSGPSGSASRSSELAFTGPSPLLHRLGLGALLLVLLGGLLLAVDRRRGRSHEDGALL